MTQIAVRVPFKGGAGNTASGARSSVSGGKNREASGENDWAVGSLSEGN